MFVTQAVNSESIPEFQGECGLRNPAIDDVKNEGHHHGRRETPESTLQHGNQLAACILTRKEQKRKRKRKKKKGLNHSTPFKYGVYHSRITQASPMYWTHKNCTRKIVGTIVVGGSWRLVAVTRCARVKFSTEPTHPQRRLASPFNDDRRSKQSRLVVIFVVVVLPASAVFFFNFFFWLL